MRLKLVFGFKATPIQCDWNKDVKDFPKIVNYSHRNWEWIAYNAIVGPLMGVNVGYELLFGELKAYDPRALEVHPTLAEIIADSIYDEDNCDCGANKHPGTGGHWKFCKIYGRK